MVRLKPRYGASVVQKLGRYHYASRAKFRSLGMRLLSLPVHPPSVRLNSSMVTRIVFLANAKLTHGSLEAADGSSTGQGEGAKAAEAASVTEPVKPKPRFSTTRAESRWSAALGWASFVSLNPASRKLRQRAILLDGRSL